MSTQFWARPIRQRSSDWLNTVRISGFFLAALTLLIGLAQAQDSVGLPTQDGFSDGMQEEIPDDFGGEKFQEVPYEIFAVFKVQRGTRAARLEVTLDFAEGYHAYSQRKLKGQTATEIVVDKGVSLISVGPFVPDTTPLQHSTLVGDPTEEFETSVTWSADIELSEDVDVESMTVPIIVNGQVCNDGGCIQFDSPYNELEATFLEYADTPFAPLEFKPSTSGDEISEAAAVIPLGTLTTYLGMAFLAGLILNAMPCVLPVIGLKVMSFVKQAGENRLKIFMLNLAFSAGLMAVFLIIATLAAFFGMGWGDWLTKSLTGSIIITGVVFAFGLSMLGVWEIPIPGLSAGSGKEEGLSGAFMLGILTTVLATPCTGPLLVPATAITVGQPAWVAYLIFTSLGLGMALPYLLVGIFPALINWLPKPGAWMDTFKQITGFILMGTVVFLLAGFAHETRSAYLVPTLTTLLAIAFGCWWIGSASYETDAKKRRNAWFWGIGWIVAGSVFAFTMLVPPNYELEWERFEIAKLEQLNEEDRLVFIDFTGPN